MVSIFCFFCPFFEVEVYSRKVSRMHALAAAEAVSSQLCCGVIKRSTWFRSCYVLNYRVRCTIYIQRAIWPMALKLRMQLMNQ